MRRVSLLLIILMIFTSVQVFAISGENQADINLEQISSGILAVKYLSESNRSVKVLVEANGLKYCYNINNIGEYEYLPLQLGEGKYKVVVFENSSANTYRKRRQEVFTYNPQDPNKVYLQSVYSIAWNDDSEAVAKAKSLAKDLKTDKQKFYVIHDYITRNFTYDYEKVKNLTSRYVPNVDSIYASKKGICYDYASLEAAMLRSVGIPTKLVKGYSEFTPGYHAWNEVYIDGSWEVSDSCYDAQKVRCGKSFETIKDPAVYNKVYQY